MLTAVHHVGSGTLLARMTKEAPEGVCLAGVFDLHKPVFAGVTTGNRLSCALILCQVTLLA